MWWSVQRETVLLNYHLHNSSPKGCGLVFVLTFLQFGYAATREQRRHHRDLRLTFVFHCGDHSCHCFSAFPVDTFWFMYVCVNVHVGAYKGQKRALDLLEPKFTDGSELPDRAAGYWAQKKQEHLTASWAISPDHPQKTKQTIGAWIYYWATNGEDVRRRGS